MGKILIATISQFSFRSKSSCGDVCSRGRGAGNQGWLVKAFEGNTFKESISLGCRLWSRWCVLRKSDIIYVNFRMDKPCEVDRLEKRSLASRWSNYWWNEEIVSYAFEQGSSASGLEEERIRNSKHTRIFEVDTRISGEASKNCVQANLNLWRTWCIVLWRRLPPCWRGRM